MISFDRHGYYPKWSGYSHEVRVVKKRVKTPLEKAQDNIEKLLQIVEGLEARIEELEKSTVRGGAG